MTMMMTVICVILGYLASIAFSYFGIRSFYKNSWILPDGSDVIVVFVPFMNIAIGLVHYWEVLDAKGEDIPKKFFRL